MFKFTYTFLPITLFALAVVRPLWAQDDPRLINVSTLEQLNAIRYDFNRDGTPKPRLPEEHEEAYRAAFGTPNCPGGCLGYELVRDLDFELPASYASGVRNLDWIDPANGGTPGTQGWDPIRLRDYYVPGGYSSDDISFMRTFEGNGYVISNLYINRPNKYNVGLFGYAGGDPHIRNLGLEGVNVTGANETGALVGELVEGAVQLCYATGSVKGRNGVGVLIGQTRRVGDERDGCLVNKCYAIGSAEGDAKVGVLVGDARYALVTSCYSMGDASGDTYVGGLVGFLIDGSIINSYSVGGVIGNVNVGGLLGGSDKSAITDSYYDSSYALKGIGDLTAGHEAQSAVSKTTDELQAPTSYTGIYDNWTDDTYPWDRDFTDSPWDLVFSNPTFTWIGGGNPWDFMGGNRYPKLRADTNGDDLETAAEFGSQLLIFVDERGAETHYAFRVDENPSLGTTLGTLLAVNAANGDEVSITLVGTSDDFELDGADLKVKDGSTFNYQTEQRYELILRLREAEITTIRPVAIEVTNSRDEDGDKLIDISTLAQLNAIRFDLNGDGVVDSDVDDVGAQAYAAAFGLGADEVACASGCFGYELTNSLDFRNGSTNPSEFSVWAEGSMAANAVSDGWEPIGSSDLDRPYTGVFQGDGYVISNLYINRKSTNGVGLFGKVDGGTIRDLGIMGGTVRGGDDVGSLVGYLGDGRSAVTFCYSTASVVGRGDVGGLVGDVTSSFMVSCYATGSVEGSDNRVGGLVGSIDERSSVALCYSTASVVGRRNSVGGLVGHVSGISGVALSYSTGVVHGMNNHVGGLVGRLSDISGVFACYSAGSVRGGLNIGGLVGNVDGRSVVSSCYSIGDVSGGSNIGGLIGYIDDSGVILASYYDNSSTSRGIGYLISNHEYQSAVSKTTSELQTPTDYTGIYGTWNIDIDNADNDNDPSTGGEDPWDFLGDKQYPRLRLDFNKDGVATVDEFGTQGMVFTDVDDVEVRNSFVIRIDEGTAEGTTVGAFSGMSATTNNPTTVALACGSDEFEVDGTDLKVKDGVTFNYQRQSRYELALEFEPALLPSFYSDISRTTPQTGAYRASVVPMAAADVDVIDIYVGGSGSLSTLLVADAVGTEAYEHPNFKLIEAEAGLHYKVQVKDISSLSVDTDHILHLYLSTDVEGAAPIRTTVVVAIRAESFNFYGSVARTTPQTEAYTASVVSTSSEDTDVIDIYVGGSGVLSVLLVADADGTEAHEHPNFKLTEAVAGRRYKVQVKDISSLSVDTDHTLHLYLTTDEAGVEPIRTTVVVAIRAESFNFYGSAARTTPQTEAYTASVVSTSSEDTDVIDIYVGGSGVLSVLLVADVDGTEAHEHPNFKLTEAEAGRHYKVQVKDISSLSVDTDHTLHLYLTTDEAGVEPIRTTVVVTIVAEPSLVDCSALSPQPREGTTRRQVVIEVVDPNDEDRDGLIDITTLDQLNAIRYDLNGDGMIDAGVSMEDSIVYEMAFGLERREVGCVSGCVGYELAEDLDFNDIDATTDGNQLSIWAEEAVTEGVTDAVAEGWAPISTYRAIFEGNGRTISNLYINRSTSNVGLFGRLRDAIIRRLGLNGGSVKGGSSTGALVGFAENGTKIRACYATVDVEGSSNVGGLVGRATSISVFITACYSTGGVRGTDSVGGFIGYVRNDDGHWGAAVGSCYSTGPVSGRSYVGGFAGTFMGVMNACYSTGFVDGTGGRVGGFIGTFVSAGVRINDSYCDSNITQIRAVGDPDGPYNPNREASTSTALLQGTIGYTGIYSDWRIDANNADGDYDWSTGSDDPWDFLGDNQYPRLKVDFNNDGIATATEFGAQTLVFVDEHGAEITPKFSVAESASPDDVVAAFPPARNIANGNEATATFVGVSDEFDAQGTNIVVKTGAVLNYQTKQRYELVFELEEGGRTITRTVLVDVINPNDVDGDGLIEIDNLEQLNAIRHDLNGDGASGSAEYRTAFNLESGESACKGGCVGYELVADLDFNDIDPATDDDQLSRWAEGAVAEGVTDAVAEGWAPIGVDFRNAFSANFEGNGHTISNLYINRPRTDNVGLFGSWVYRHDAEPTGFITNLGLKGGSVRGANSTGALVGHTNKHHSRGSVIRSCYSTVDVEGIDNVGGFIGYAERITAVITSYTTGSVTGRNVIGGLIGRVGPSSSQGIVSCYSTANVHGVSRVGGLMGGPDGSYLSPNLVTSYSIGYVTGSSSVGGLMGEQAGSNHFGGSFFASTCCEQAIGHVWSRNSEAGTKKTVAELQNPTDYTGIYEDWNVDLDNADGDGDRSTGGDNPWDFLGDNRYPKLRVDFNNDGVATVAEFGPQLLIFVDENGIEVNPAFTIDEGTDDATVLGTFTALNAESDAQISRNLIGTNDDFEVTDTELKVASGATIDYQMDPRYELPFELTDGDLSMNRNVRVNVLNPNDEDGDGLIDVSTVDQLSVIRFDLNGDGMIDAGVSTADSVAYETAFELGRGGVACTDGCSGYELVADLDFNDIDPATDGDQLSRWAEGAVAEGVTDAVAEGWYPIGDASNPYRGSRGYTRNIFEGNGHTISNLFINRPTTDNVGLFGRVSGDYVYEVGGVTIRNLGLERGSVSGRSYTGALVGYVDERNTIESCYTKVHVDGVDNVGGFVGYVGEHAGGGTNVIRSCYTKGHVEGVGNVGGFVGYVDGAWINITSCYSTANVEGSNNVGGFVGNDQGGGDVYICYSIGRVNGANNVGSFIGRIGYRSIYARSYNNNYYNSDDIVIEGTGLANYTDIDERPRAYELINELIIGGTTSELQAPVDYTGIYEDWNIDLDNADGDNDRSTERDDPWDFVGDNRYPKLKVDFNNDGNTSALEFGGQTLVLVDGSGAELPRSPVFNIAGDVAEGTIIGTLSAINATNGNTANITLLGTSDEFELDGADLKVKAGATLNYQTEHRYILPLQLEEGGLTTLELIAVEIINPLDADEDGLISVSTLDQLNAIRYDLSGSGIPTGTEAEQALYRTAFGLAAGANNTCTNGCVGYELAENLDFDDTDLVMADNQHSIWSKDCTTNCVTEDRDDGAGGTTPVKIGWEPIGSHSRPYRAVFEGNGRTISNLFIDRSNNYIGLFGRVNGGAIRNLGLERGSVSGGSSSSALVGYIEGGTIVESCYAALDAIDGASNVGGLVGYLQDGSSITSCYSTGRVNGAENSVGGLVGNVKNGVVVASYSTGNVDGADNVGGFVGYVEGSGSVIASYSLGDVSGTSNVGSFAGNLANGGAITDSYYDNSSALKGIGNLAAGHGQQIALSRTTSELQTPADYTDIYANWDIDLDNADTDDDRATGGDNPWDFVGANRYPKLRVDFNNDEDPTALEFGSQLLVLVDGSGVETPRFPVIRIEESTPVTTTVGTVSAVHATNGTEATPTLVGMSDEFELSTADINVKATLNYQARPRHELLLDFQEGDLMIRRPVVIEITNPNDEDADGLIDITTLEQLNVVRFDLNGDGMIDAGVSMMDSIAYEMAFGLGRGDVACASGCVGYELTESLDFNDIDAATDDDQLSVWAEGAVAANIPEAVADGWPPIGNGASPYTATFEGNGRTISNIFIDRSSDYTGLFGRVNGGAIRNLGLEGGSVSGGSSTSALAGAIEGGTIVESCYVALDLVEGAHNVGGLVGYLQSGSSITSSYSIGTVSGTDNSIGGLVGHLRDGSVVACYSAGNVDGANNVGGLVGYLRSGSSVIASYSIVSVDGSDGVGGLVGKRDSRAEVIDSYHDDSSILKGIGSLLDSHSLQSAVSRTTSELQTPTDYTDTYLNWNIDLDDEDEDADRSTGADNPWDFVGNNRYPKLRIDFNNDGTATSAEFGPQLLILLDEGGAEARPMLKIVEDTPAGTALATFSAVNVASNTPVSPTLIGTSEKFELDATTVLKVKDAVTFDYQMEHRFELLMELNDGALTIRRPIVVEITNPNDEDDDGLIDISTLTRLNAVRFDLNGDGMVDAGVSMENALVYEMAFGLESGEVACAGGCEGYELTESLDFNDIDAATDDDQLSVWAEGAFAAGIADAVPGGWMPIGDDASPYVAIFEGNGRTISNLYISRSSIDNVGLFGRVNGGIIRNLGLEVGNATGEAYTGALIGYIEGNTIVESCYAAASVRGGHDVGSLIGRMVSSNVTSCYSTGSVRSTESNIGGLVGYVGRGSSVTACYSTANVNGLDQVGGLVGYVDNGSSVTACYSIGAVNGSSEVGGFVGYLGSGSSVTACYSIGAVNGSSEVGGLVGNLAGGVITASYYDNLSVLKGIGSLAASHDQQTAVSKTTSELQTPTDYTDIYAGWNIDLDHSGDLDNPWDFVKASVYPKLRVDFNNDGVATVAEFGPQLLVLLGDGGREAVSVLRVAENTTPGTVISMLSGINLENDNQVDFGLVGTSNEFELVDTNLQIRTGAMLDYQTEHRHELLIVLQEEALTARRHIAIEITNPNDEDDNGLIDISTLNQLNAVRFDLNGDGMVDAGVSTENALVYETAFGLEPGEVACASGCEGYELVESLDFNDIDAATDDDQLSVWAEGASAAGVADAVPEGWMPIGDATSPYAAIFWGRGHTISNLYINRLSTENVGLFGRLGRAIVHSLGLEGGSVTGGSYTGALAGYIESTTTVHSCYSNVDIEGTNNVGGFVAI